MRGSHTPCDLDCFLACRIPRRGISSTYAHTTVLTLSITQQQALSTTNAWQVAADLTLQLREVQGQLRDARDATAPTIERLVRLSTLDAVARARQKDVMWIMHVPRGHRK